MQNTITINGLALTGLLKLAAKKDVRLCLLGVKVEATPERTRLIATDGHVIGIYEESPGKNCPNVVPGGYYEGIMPREALDKLRVTQREHTLTLAAVGRDVTLCNYGVEITFKTLDATFPEYQRIIPEAPTGEVGLFNPELLAKFLPIAKALGGGGHIVQLHQNGKHDAALVTLDKRPGFVGALMPMRAAEAAPKAHLWARGYLKPADPGQATA